MRCCKIMLVAAIYLFLPNFLLANGVLSPCNIWLLKQKIFKMQDIDSECFSVQDTYYRHQLAISQVNVVKMEAAYETYIFLERHGNRRSIIDINNIVNAAWECSFIFTDLGPDHMSRFIRILEWCKTESDFKPTTISRWRKGEYIRSLNTYIKKSTTDYGPWQINKDNFQYAKKTYWLYELGVIPFKIIRLHSYTDLFDINTNCAARCIIETDRKALGWEWRHHKDCDQPYVCFLSEKLYILKHEGAYDDDLVSRYYKLEKIKTYTARHHYWRN